MKKILILGANSYIGTSFIITLPHNIRGNMRSNASVCVEMHGNWKTGSDMTASSMSPGKHMRISQNYRMKKSSNTMQ